MRCTFMYWEADWCVEATVRDGSVYYSTSKSTLQFRGSVEAGMNLPSREECEAWDQAQVAFFMSKNLSDGDMNKFSLIHQPQLQKIVQDIKKNDGGLLNKIRRLKSKPIPKVPARDYRGNDEESDDQFSEAEYDNDAYEQPLEEQDGNYEPPPTQKDFTSTSSSFLRGEYLDSCHNRRPEQPPRKPFRPARVTKPLPPKPTQQGSDEDDYINPDGEDDYIEPTEKPLADPVRHGGTRGVMVHPMLSTPLPARPISPDCYEVPDKEENSLPASRLYPILTQQSHALPPIPSPRMNMTSSPALPEPTSDDDYEVCDPDESSRMKSKKDLPQIPPKPMPRERSPNPAIRPRPDVTQKEFESRSLPIIHNEQNHAIKTFSLDLKRPKIPLPHVFNLPNLPGKTDRGRFPAENGLIDEDQQADVYNKLWYAGACDRKTADDVLNHINKDGAYLVRKSSGHDTHQPYTLVVFYNGKVYNIPIRFLQTIQQYALGKEKKGEEHFNSVSHIIEIHQRTPLVLIDIQSNCKDAIKLCYPVRP
ncbi:B-cell linker protein isoform X2 [Genypterus blacodes]|uniref:B-cell linker protein isoform X2 n=1 Tax=Genypterus blacodes TaxID=154954 RepID=UPI003F75C880